jgi:FkbM family methyltransferase
MSRYTPTIEVEGEGGVRYFIDTRDGGVGFQVFMERGFDARAMERIAELVERETSRSLKDRVFVDIGANIGTTTALALMRYGARAVIAVEPSPRNIELLNLTLQINGLQDRTRIYEVALSDHEGTATIAIDPHHGGDNRIITSNNSSLLSWRPTEDVAMTVLDSLQIDYDEVSIAWMDVQGYEGYVLAGASKLLESDVPVLIEYGPMWLRTAGGLDMLHDLVACKFDRCIDCRTGDQFPADALSNLAALYPGNAYTDVLLLH